MDEHSPRGSITLSDFEKGFGGNGHGVRLTKSFDFQRAFDAFDFNQTGEVAQFEYQELVRDRMKLSPDLVRHIYFLIDSDKKGTVTKTEFAKVFRDPERLRRPSK